MLKLLQVAIHWLLVSTERLFLILIHPRSILLIVFGVLIGGVTYYLYEHPAIGIAVRNFLSRTLPAWFENVWKFTTRFWPKVALYLPWAAIKKYAKIILIFFVLPLLSSYRRKQLQALKPKLILNLVVRPLVWWEGLTRAKRYLIVVTIFAIILSIPGLHYLGYVFFPYIIIGELLLIFGRWAVVKFGAEAFVAVVHAALIKILVKIIPTKSLVKYKKQYLYAIAKRKLQLKGRSKALTTISKALWKKRRQNKKTESKVSTEVSDET